MLIYADDESVASARRLLEAAMQKGREKDGAGKETPGLKVDKYFGTKLPPVCAQLGCYVTDDGKRYYCVNHACQKHKKRETKHTRKGRPQRGQFVYFKCPKCESRRVDMHILANRYTCRTCKYVWER